MYGSRRAHFQRNRQGWRLTAAQASISENEAAHRVAAGWEPPQPRSGLISVERVPSNTHGRLATHRRTAGGGRIDRAGVHNSRQATTSACLQAWQRLVEAIADDQTPFATEHELLQVCDDTLKTPRSWSHPYVQKTLGVTASAGLSQPLFHLRISSCVL